jgi:hypothetical protein
MRLLIVIVSVFVAPGHGAPPPPPWVIAFMIVWVILALISFLFFQFNRNAAVKRAVRLPLIVVVGIVFAAFLYYQVGHQQPQILYIAVPAIILISFLNIRMVRFCDSCGKTIYQQLPFSRPRYCPYCGAKLDHSA